MRDSAFSFEIEYRSIIIRITNIIEYIPYTIYIIQGVSEMDEETGIGALGVMTHVIFLKFFSTFKIWVFSNYF